MADASILVSPAKSKAEAQAMGLTRYFTGNPCKHGHTAERYTKTEHCVACRRLQRLPNRPLRCTAIDDEGVTRKIISRAAAFSLGLHHYFTGLKCKHGHLSERLVNGGCCECAKQRVNNNRERLREYSRDYARRLRLRKGAKPRNPLLTKPRAQRRLMLAGRPPPDLCEICKEVRHTRFDHCHTTGHFRGWICDRCNLTLGNVKDDPSLLRKFAEYLELHISKHSQVDWVLKAEAKTVLQMLR